ncbi:nucleoside kinase [Clostridium sp. LBM24168]
MDGKVIDLKKGTNLYKIFKDNYDDSKLALLVKINGKYFEFTDSLNEGGIFEPIDLTDPVGSRTYERTLQFVLIKAVYDLFDDSEVIIEHSLGKAIYGEIKKTNPLSEKDIIKIKEKMKEIINKDIPINKVRVTKNRALEIFKKYNMIDKVKLLNHINTDCVNLYELNGLYDYFYSSMAYSTGVLQLFDLMYYDSGFLLIYPDKDNPEVLPQFVEYKKLNRIFIETKKWHNILEVSDVGSLNDKVINNDIVYMIRVAEALHEKKIAYIADMISERNSIKVVLIAGPSSSGKTTFSRRLAIQLGVNGYKPLTISLDDYFVERKYTPLDENGNYDFESIYALDLKLFNQNLQMLMEGKEVELPGFNFRSGHREWSGQKVILPQNGIILIEGIHGLNEILTSSILPRNKFKIYISALTQLNLDNHNRIATTDVRIIRRIVRDYISRGYNGEDTLKMWPSIKKGEEKNIFIFQENADVMFNSTLVYELCVLKKYALQELRKIKKTSDVYCEALRLISFLNFFKSVDEDFVPDNSILREFIGGSCFYKY